MENQRNAGDSRAAFDSLVLKHYGVKGMKWGVRKDKIAQRSATKKANRAAPNSADHERTATARQTARDGGVQKLSNKELQDVVTRMNLEQQYRNLEGNTPSARAKERGRKALVDAVVDVGLDTAVSMVPGGPLAKAAVGGAANIARTSYGSGPVKKRKD